MTAMHLVLLAAVASLTAPRLLPRVGWVYRSPRLGLVAWYAVLATVALSLAGAASSMLVGWPDTRDVVCAWWAWCLEAVHGGHGVAGRVAGGAVLAAGLALVGRLAVTGWRMLAAARRRRRRHMGMLAAVARRCPELDAVVVDCAQPAAYVLPGRRGAVVVTRGAVESLPGAQLAAVLAHERAHAAGRHQLLVDVARLLTVAFPSIGVFAHAHRQIDRLVEMRADEVATRGHARLDLARALVAMAEAAAVSVPAETVAATGGDAWERMHRLLSPPARLSRGAWVVAVLGLSALVAAPMLLVGLTVAFPMLGGCLPLSG